VKRYQNALLLIGVLLLLAVPLWMVKSPVPGPDGKKIEIFRGSDDHAKDVITAMAPEYKPWSKPLLEPPGGEISSLFFALQAALGAGFIGYWYGCAKTRAKMNQTTHKDAEC
jgi:cobalt/nickel transport protein